MKVLSMALKRTLLPLLAVSLISTAHAAASTATIIELSGSAIVKMATGAVVAEIGAPLLQGHEILVGPDSMSSLNVDGCTVILAPSSHYVVPAAAPCAMGDTLFVGDVSIRPTNGDGAGGGGLVGGGSKVALVAAGALALVGIIGFIALSDDENDPAS